MSEIDYTPCFETGWFDDERGWICMLPDGHDGPHETTPDDQVGVTFAEADGMPGE